MKRVKIREISPAPEMIDNGLFLESEPASRPTFSTGCTVLDLHLGGGYCEGQIIQIAGASQAGKSLLVTEAAANFLLKHRKAKGRVRVVDTENAFDSVYCAKLGIDPATLETPGIDELPHTIEAVMKDIDEYFRGKKVKGKQRTRLKKQVPLLYAVDSWDALATDEELEKGMEEGGGFTGARKAIKGSDFGRKVSAWSKRDGFTLICVSQLRNNISGYGATKYTAGGNWMQFYATQLIWVSNAKPIEATRKGHKRQLGRWIKIEAKKNRRAGPSHEIMIPLIFGYGIDDLAACIRYLIDEKVVQRMFEKGRHKTPEDAATKFLGKVYELPDKEYRQYLKQARKEAKKLFLEIQEAFQPLRSKYGG